MPLPLLLFASLSSSQTFRAQFPVSTRHYHRTLRSEALEGHGEAQFILLVPPVSRPATVRQTFPLTLGTTEEHDEQSLIAAINAERTERGLDPLQPDRLLSGAARAHSREMCDLDYFDHYSPTAGLETPMARYLHALHDWGAEQPLSASVGENVFYCSATSAVYNAAYAHQSLMNSPGHRANILEPRFTKVGVGLYRDGRGRFWVTEMFLRDE